MSVNNIYIAKIDCLEAEIKTLLHDVNNSMCVIKLSQDIINTLKEENNILRSERDYYRHELEKKI